MVFSLLGAAVYTTVIVGGFVFIFVWPISRRFIWNYVAIAIGHVSVIGVVVHIIAVYSGFVSHHCWVDVGIFNIL